MGTSTGPLNKVFGLEVAGRFRGGYPRPPGQEDPDPSPQRVQAGWVLKKAACLLALPCPRAAGGGQATWVDFRHRGRRA